MKSFFLYTAWLYNLRILTFEPFHLLCFFITCIARAVRTSMIMSNLHIHIHTFVYMIINACSRILIFVHFHFRLRREGCTEESLVELKRRIIKFKSLLRMWFIWWCVVILLVSAWEKWKRYDAHACVLIALNLTFT